MLVRVFWFFTTTLATAITSLLLSVQYLLALTKDSNKTYMGNTAASTEVKSNNNNNQQQIIATTTTTSTAPPSSMSKTVPTPKGEYHPHLFPLHNAVDAFDVDKLKQLIKRKTADVNLADEHGDTALHCAARHGAVDCMRILIDSGCDLTKKNNDNFSPADIAKLDKKADCVRMLEQAGVHPTHA